MNICLICLRTDRLLKLASNVLEEFHDELCEFSVVTMASFSYYCSECEYLLTKFYKFRIKCVKALKIYQKWMSTKDSKKQPINLLYTLLPPSSLGAWTANSEKIGDSTLHMTDSQTDICFEVELINDTFPKEVKLEYDQTDSSDNIDICPDVLKIENISENVPKSEHIDEIKNDCEAEDHLFENLGKQLEKDVGECTDLSIIKHDTEASEKITKVLKPKKLPRKKQTEKKDDDVTKNLLELKKRPKKPMSEKKKAYFDRFREDDKRYESVFDIEYLTTQDMRLEEFQKRNTYENYVNAEHKCEICYQVVKSLKFLKYHTKKWHNESTDSVLCPICKTWNSKKSKHRRTHSVVFKCKLCPLITYHRKTMQNHFEQHKGKQYHCEQCNITYKSKSAYSNHMGKVHRRGRNVCEGCGRGFRSPLGLKIHKNNSARCTGAMEPSAVSKETIEGVRCDECDVTLPSKQVFDAHVADVHEVKHEVVTRPPATNSAALPGTEPRVLRKPRKKYIRLTPAKHTCRVCNEFGTSFAWLQLHFKREHPNEDINLLYADKKTHLCDICGTGFSNVYALRSHMNLHTGARPFSCDICPKRFRSAYLMREHRLRHFPSTVPCTYCGKSFKTTGNLYTHMKTHTGEKEHKCEICGKAFLYLVNMKEHVRGVHYNIRRPKRGGTRQGAADTGAGKGAKRRKEMISEVETDNDFSDSSE